MTTDTLLLILTGLCAFLAAAVVWLVLEMRLLKIQTSENLRRDEHDEMIEAILTGVRSERQEVQQAVLNVERGVSQTLAGLTGYLTEQQNRSAAEVRTLNETARQSLAETREVMNRQLLELQGLVDARFAKIIETNASASEALGAKLESKFSEIRTSVDASLEKVRAGNEARLEEMRATVQEKLDRTLSERLTASFRTVDEKLGLVQTGLGEMRTMAESVRDLKGILANVKTRGTFGETQLASILANILTPAQYGAQVRVVPESREAVDFAVRMPGASGDGPCWLPMDSKFPVEDYARLLDAEARADAAAATQARAALERAVLVQAKSIHDKYVRPPYTTEFAVMYLPSEGLYAEVIRIPGLFEKASARLADHACGTDGRLGARQQPADGLCDACASGALERGLEGARRGQGRVPAVRRGLREGAEEVLRGAVEPRCNEDAPERDAEEDEFDRGGGPSR